MMDYEKRADNAVEQWQDAPLRIAARLNQQTEFVASANILQKNDGHDDHRFEVSKPARVWGMSCATDSLTICFAFQ